MVENRNNSQEHAPHPRKVAVVGAGKVGSTFAYALLLSGLVGEIALMDVDHRRAEGEAMDLNHAVPLSNPVRIWAGDYPDCAGADVVVVAAGTAQRPGETRLDLVRRNAAIFGDIIPQITAYNTTGILLIATNPVDILSHVAWKASGFPSRRVIGSGTVLDTARFRYLLGEHLGVDPRNVHAYVVGEHGDSEVPVWSLINVAGMRLDDFCRREDCDLGSETRKRISEQTRDAAYEIIQRKGATHYAVAVGLLRIVESVLRDQHTVLAVSSLVSGNYGIEDVYLSLPAVVGREGVERVLHMPLDDRETVALRESAMVLRGVLDELEN
ncbi:MAG: L-lactate dehydrogenase [Chloroflexota bacterium]|nr:L-lactate dehydrogenase [Chloroflexota bacterium]